MSHRYSLLVAAATLATSAQIILGQNTISVHSGLIQYTSGAVTVGDQPIAKTTTNVLSLKAGDVLETGADGAVEVLMTPGVFVRMVGDSSLRMDSVSLADTRVTILTGTAMVECLELIKGDHVSFFVSSVAGSPSIEVRKASLFRITAEPPSVSVIQGEVFAAGVTVSKDKVLQLGVAVLHPEKFKPNKQEDLFMFSEARAADDAYASNVTSHSVYSSGGTCMASSWYFMNPVGMYAYLPCSGFNNFFGYPFFGVNFGYMYGGIPCYYPPPTIVCGTKGCPPVNAPHTKQPVTVASNKVTTSLASSAVRMAGVLGQSQAPSNGLMKVPAFTSVLNTQPTYLTVSRANYMANLPGSSGNSRVINSSVAPSSGGNKYMAATSLSASRSVSSHSSGASFGGGSSGGTHYSGGASVASSGHSSGGSFSGGGGSFGGGGGHASSGGGGSAGASAGGGGHK